MNNLFEIQETRVCTKCKIRKLFSEFYSHSTGKYKLSSICKECDSLTCKAWKAKNKERAAHSKREYNLKRRYGIDIEFYEYLLKSQGGKCAICDNTLGTNDGHRLAVDHCHKTKKVRGLLCKVCNNAIGLFRENELYFKNAIKYLKGEK